MSSMIKKFDRHLFNKSLANSKVAENTILAYNFDIDILQAEFRQNLCSVTEEEFRDYETRMVEAGKSNSTICRHGATLNRVYRAFGIDRKVSPKNSRSIRVIPTYLLPKYVNKLIKSMNSRTIYECRDILLIAVLYGTGMRISDALTLRVRDVEYENNKVHSIGDVSWVCPDINLKEALDYFSEAHTIPLYQTSYLFYSNKDKSAPVSRKSAWRFIQNLFKNEFDLDVTPSDLRHSYGCSMADNKFQADFIGELMGISDESALVYISSKKSNNRKIIG